MFLVSSSLIYFVTCHIFLIFIDIDDCASQTHDCSSKGECINMDGSYQCECQPGFTGNGKTCNGRSRIYDCVFINFVLFISVYQCVEDVILLLFLFLFIYLFFFTDIDECTTEAHDCSSNGICSNVDGSFQCVCEPGFTGYAVVGKEYKLINTKSEPPLGTPA